MQLAAPDLLTALPCTLAVDDGPPEEVCGWAGPWPLTQRWWVPGAVAGSRLQVLRADGVAFLLFGCAGRWEVVGAYD